MSFQQINIEAGTLSSGEVLYLNLIGTNITNLSYVFPGGFTVGPQGRLLVGPGRPGDDRIRPDAHRQRDALLRHGRYGVIPRQRLRRWPGADRRRLAPQRKGTTFNNGGLSITVNNGGVINPTDCTFNIGIAVPYVDVPALTDNVSFEQIEIEAGTLSGELDLNAIGTNTTNLSMTCGRLHGGIERQAGRGGRCR